MFSIIAAIGSNLEIGFKNSLIWRIPEDLNFFRETTMGHKIVMGRKTFESLPGVLSKRKNMVITSRKIDNKNITIIDDLDKFISENKNSPEEIFVIGGASVYSYLLPYSNKLYLTEIDAGALSVDTYFPEFDKNQYNKEVIYQGGYNGIEYKRTIYIKK